MFNALFSAKGRMRRRDWWLWSIGLGIAYGVIAVTMDTVFGTGHLSEDTAAFPSGPFNGFDVWLVFAYTVGQWPGVCLTAKRWHDRNRPGWFALISPALNIANLIALRWGAHAVTKNFSAAATPGIWDDSLANLPELAVSILLIIYGIWLLIDCGILDGTKGPNRYGPSPKGLGTPQADVF